MTSIRMDILKKRMLDWCFPTFPLKKLLWEMFKVKEDSQVREVESN
jgi:hypothetical protein